MKIISLIYRHAWKSFLTYLLLIEVPWSFEKISNVSLCTLNLISVAYEGTVQGLETRVGYFQ